MIIEEINKIKKNQEQIEEMREILDDFSMPYKYQLKKIDEELYLVKGQMFFQKIALLKLDKDIINVFFNYEKDLEKIRRYFKDSKIKFKLILGEEYYF